MQRREPFEALLSETLTRGWSEQFGHPVEVSAPGRQWQMQPLISAYFSADVDARARRYLRDSFRYTPVRSRAIAQWLLGTALASPIGLRLSGRPGFDVTPPLEHADATLVIPGNQRIRVMNFETGRSRVFLKQGFNSATIENEIAVRGAGASGPFPQIEAHADDGHWFEEPLLDAQALPRCPPRFDRAHCAEQAVQLLNQWLESTQRKAASAEYVAALLSRCSEDLAQVAKRFGSDWTDMSATLALVAELAAKAGDITLAQSHGDFQAGNILVSNADGAVTLIDWEHSAVRSRDYDLFVYDLQSRASVGLAQRLRAGLNKGLPHTEVSRERLSLFLLEDLSWFLHESLTGPFEQPSEGLVQYRSELVEIEEILGARP
jgi:hypothetical protein